MSYLFVAFMLVVTFFVSKGSVAIFGEGELSYWVGGLLITAILLLAGRDK